MVKSGCAWIQRHCLFAFDAWLGTNTHKTAQREQRTKPNGNVWRRANTKRGEVTISLSGLYFFIMLMTFIVFFLLIFFARHFSSIPVVKTSSKCWAGVNNATTSQQWCGAILLKQSETMSVFRSENISRFIFHSKIGERHICFKKKLALIFNQSFIMKCVWKMHVIEHTMNSLDLLARVNYPYDGIPSHYLVNKYFRRNFFPE